MMGVPAQQVGWISRHGISLPEPDAEAIMVCPESGYHYKEVEPGVLRCLDFDEEAPLPSEESVGKISYREVKKR